MLLFAHRGVTVFLSRSASLLSRCYHPHLWTREDENLPALVFGSNLQAGFARMRDRLGGNFSASKGPPARCGGNTPGNITAPARYAFRMTVPTYDKFIEPILRYLAQHPAGMDAKLAHDAAADALKLTEHDREQLLPSGTQPIYKNRAGWAHDRLKRAGLSSSPKRGFWKLTPEGMQFAKQHVTSLSAEAVEKLALGFVSVKLKPDNNSPGTSAPDVSPQLAGSAQVALASPDDRLEQALAELRQAAINEILESIGQVSPGFFETIVLDVLHKMGYGASRADLQRVGGSGDAGIDGIISLDRLGLEKVYVQAKKWAQQAVGRPELQAFYGALAGQKARKGVFITTSTYSTPALDFAKSVEGMVLIDGPRLAALMIDYEVGVTSRVLKIPKVDGDYFDQDGA